MAGSRATKILSVKDQIADQLRSDIISGELKPQTKLNETELAERFGLSRGPIRDVILQLTKEGLLVTRSNCGASVNNVLAPNMQKLMIKLRCNIEEYAINELNGQLTEMHFSELETILASLETALNKDDYTEVTKIDISFHQYLVYQAGGDELVNIWYPYVMRMQLNYKRITYSYECINEHRAIIDGLKEKDNAKVMTALKLNIK